MRRLVRFLSVVTAVAVIAFFVARRRHAVVGDARGLDAVMVPAGPGVPNEQQLAGGSRQLPSLTGAPVSAYPPAETAPSASEEPDLQMRAFQAKVNASIEECSKAGTCDSRRLLMEQVGMAFDLKLGPDHPRRQELTNVVGWSFDARDALSKRFLAKEIDRKQMFRGLTAHFAEMAKRYGDLLDDTEYETMFGSKKGKNPAEYFGLTDEAADKLDREAAASAVAAAPVESGADPEDFAPERTQVVVDSQQNVMSPAN